MDQWGIGRSEGPEQNFQASHRINPACEKVLCAMEKIWGAGAAYMMLYIRLRHNFNVSEFAFDHGQRPSAAQLEEIAMALDDLPPAMIPAGRRNQRLGLYRGGDLDKVYRGRDVYANAGMMLFDNWEGLSSEGRQHTILHEVGHNFALRNRRQDMSPEWLSLSGWLQRGDRWTPRPNGCFASVYGRGNPAEDYAVSFKAYRYNGAEFRAHCPQKYEFLKAQVFGGMEYVDERTCSRPRA
jgi:hypothetical protein